MVYDIGPKAGSNSYAAGKRWLIIVSAIVIFFSSVELSFAKDKKSNPKEKKQTTSSVEAAPAPVKRETVTIPAADNILQASDIFVGNINSNMVNPRCIDIDTLLSSMPETRDAKKAQDAGSLGKYWILRARASERMEFEIKQYVEAKDIGYLCKRDQLFVILRKLDQYKSKSDDELIAGFDISDELIEYFEKKNSEKKGKDKNE